MKLSGERAGPALKFEPELSTNRRFFRGFGFIAPVFFAPAFVASEGGARRPRESSALCTASEANAAPASAAERRGKKVAGHSKWANIQHRKGRADAHRGKVFTKLIKEVTVAAKMGGGDPAMNPRLRLAIDKAKAASMPKDNIENAIKRGTGQLDGVSYEEVRYEGYGIGGAAVMVDCLTDNKTRTVAEVRHAFSKHGGNMGVDGSVAFQFKHCGQLIFAPGTDEATLMDAAIEAGAEDVASNDDGSIEVLTAPDASFATVKEALEKAGFKAEIAEITMKPLNDSPLAGDDALKMQKLLDALDDLDDVQDVYTTADLSE
jgi:YebC/PmpR family DNA-binding regulatory protein